MIDIHNHILFGIDDGSRSLEESINIIKKAIENGYTAIVLTPHYRLIQNYKCDNKKKYKIFCKLKEEVNKRNLPIELYLGNEITLDEDLFYYLNTEQVLSLNGSRYLLLELPFESKFKELDEILDLLIEKGGVPIIAHPERYKYYNIRDYKRLLKKGVLFQGNIGSLYGKYGLRPKQTLEKMLKKNMIHFIASDIHHDTQTSYDRVLDAMKIVEKLTNSKKKVQDLFITNALKVINDEEINPHVIYKKKYKLKWFKNNKRSS